jgi:hypothetical protein
MNPSGNKAGNVDLHGNAPDKSPVALLLIDVINDLDWRGAQWQNWDGTDYGGALDESGRRAGRR